MWKQLVKSVNISSGHTLITPATQSIYQQTRTTFILKRRWPPGLYKKGTTSKLLKSRHYIYDLVEKTNYDKNRELDVILTDYVSGFGNRGDRVSVKEKLAYHNLLLPGLAVYASPENIEKHSKFKGVDKPKFSSPYVEKTIELLSNARIICVMNKEVPWTIEPWHVKMSLRKAGFHVPEEAITLPEEPISGPNVELQDKYFEAVVTINNTEEVSVKCIVHHWSTFVSDKIPTENLDKTPPLPIFPEIKSDTSNPN